MPPVHGQHKPLLQIDDEIPNLDNIPIWLIFKMAGAYTNIINGSNSRINRYHGYPIEVCRHGRRFRD